MNVTEKLCLWGVTHAAARHAELAAQKNDKNCDEVRRQAKLLRERADRLHREVYLELGPDRASATSSRAKSAR